jgi:hypothetical protein
MHKSCRLHRRFAMKIVIAQFECDLIPRLFQTQARIDSKKIKLTNVAEVERMSIIFGE